MYSQISPEFFRVIKFKDLLKNKKATDSWKRANERKKTEQVLIVFLKKKSPFLSFQEKNDLEAL